MILGTGFDPKKRRRLAKLVRSRLGVFSWSRCSPSDPLEKFVGCFIESDDLQAQFVRSAFEYQFPQLRFDSYCGALVSFGGRQVCWLTEWPTVYPKPNVPSPVSFPHWHVDCSLFVTLSRRCEQGQPDLHR